MSLLSNLSARLGLGKKEEHPEYYFAINIGPQSLTAALWAIEHNQLKVINTSSFEYSSMEEIISVVDKLLGELLSNDYPEPQKVLFGVPDSWLQDEDLQESYMKFLRRLVKELELTPMAYVASSHALSHFLEKQTGTPTTAILVGLDEKYVTVTVVRAGKLDTSKVSQRGNNLGEDIEKLLLSFTAIEVLPSKIILYGNDHLGLDKHKNQLLEYSWMSKLSFLHVPKIESLGENVEIDSVAFAGAVELNPAVEFKKLHAKEDKDFKPMSEEEIIEQVEEVEEEKKGEVSKELKDIEEDSKYEAAEKEVNINKVSAEELGFVTGDIRETNLVVPEAEDFEKDMITTPPAYDISTKKAAGLGKKLKFIQFLSIKDYIKGRGIYLSIVISVFLLLLGGYLFLLKSDVKVFVEPQILEKDAQIVADPAIKEVNEADNKIPGQSVDIRINGTGKGAATGTKQVGDPAKGTVVVYNKTFEPKSFSKGTTLTAANGFKYTLDVNVNIASQSASDSGISFGKANAEVTAANIGADGNLPSGSDLNFTNFSSSQVGVKAEGNFSGGTSKEVTVVSDADQKKLLAQVASDLKGQAKAKLQEKYPDKKILEEALQEEIVKKTFSKNINDQASELSLDLTVNFKGTAFEDKDLKQLVSKLVSVNVPEGFELNLAETETLADVSKLEKDGRLVFLARFKAKLIPKVDISEIKKLIRGKTPLQVEEILKRNEHILGTEIKLIPSLPSVLQRLPIFDKNIRVEVGLK
ncbi:baseplate J/gp47 family protein [Candidatus Daviesbacteria bacterium]|nr:baseplate J/gp47 family protein [Candidatus Daviesbacteria bacterium]